MPSECSRRYSLRGGFLTIIIVAVAFFLAIAFVSAFVASLTFERRTWVLIPMTPDAETRARVGEVLAARAKALRRTLSLSRTRVVAVGDAFEVHAVGRGQLAEFVEVLARPGMAEFREGVMAEESTPGMVTLPPGKELKQYVYEEYDLRKAGTIAKRNIPLLVSAGPGLAVGSPKTVLLRIVGLSREPIIYLELADVEAERFAELTGRLSKGSVLVLLIDGEARAFGRVPQKIEDGRVELRGLLDVHAAQRIVDTVRIGPLPCPVSVSSPERVFGQN